MYKFYGYLQHVVTSGDIVTLNIYTQSVGGVKMV